VRRRHNKNEYGNCVEVSIPAEDSVIDAYLQGTIHVHLAWFGEAMAGYFRTGAILPSAWRRGQGFTNPKKLLQDFLVSTGFATDAKVRGFPVPAGGVRRKTTADRILLAGDAAGFVDPFTGEGIAFAIRSGQLAAETVALALKHGDLTRQGLAPYVTRCQREFGESLGYSLVLSRLMHRFPNIFLKMMASEAEPIERYVQDALREQSYKTYFAWLLPRLPRLWFKMMTQRQRPA